MTTRFTTQAKSFAKRAMIGAACLALVACAQQPGELTPAQLDEHRAQLNETLADPVARTRLIAKVFGSTEEMERHAFLKFHVFGFTGEGNLVPFFTMNNYIIQKWSPGEDDSFGVEHYEVAYYSEFDTDKAISQWTNPFTDEVIELPHFVLGPVPRFYSPGMSKDPASFAPDPLNITMIGDRVYIPTLTRFQFPGTMTTEEWGRYGGGSQSFWDSMLVYSADIEDVLDETKSHVPAEIHMQNLVSWAPYLKMGDAPGRTMVRAYGQHISGYDALPQTVRANLEEYTPEIFDLASWQAPRIDGVEYMQKLVKQRSEGTLDIDQPGYTAPKIKSFFELEDF